MNNFSLIYFAEKESAARSEMKMGFFWKDQSKKVRDRNFLGLELKVWQKKTLLLQCYGIDFSRL